MMERLILVNRFTPAPDGWVLLAPAGEYAHAGAGVVQVIDAAAVDAMVANHTGEALLDFEHESHDGAKRTEAAGWIAELENREGSLWGRVRWSDIGQAALEGGRYRYISPVFDRRSAEDLGDSRLRPTRLLDAGLTNRPNLPVPALANTETFPTASAAGDAESNQTAPEPPEPQTGDHTLMDLKAQLSALLGLAPEATDDAVLAALANHRATHEAQQQRLTQLEGELANRDLDAAGITDPAERAAWARLLNTDREAAAAALRGRAAVGAGHPAPLTNRDTARVPVTPASGDLSTLRNRAVADYMAAHKCGFEPAWNAVRLAQPNLFTKEEHNK